MEQIEFNLVFRWFVGLGMDDPVWDASTFCHNRDRLLEADISALVLNGVIEHRKVRGLLSRDHLSKTGKRRKVRIDGRATLRRQPAYPQVDRGDLRLGQNPKRPGQDQVPGTAAGRCIIHLEPGGL